MNKFPKKEDSREQWRINCETLCGMTDWHPPETSALCEYHFTPEMWEKPRVDGTKKLRINAIPTVFGDGVHQVKARVPKKSQFQPKIQELIEHSYGRFNHYDLNENNTDVSPLKVNLQRTNCYVPVQSSKNKSADPGCAHPKDEPMHKDDVQQSSTKHSKNSNTSSPNNKNIKEEENEKTNCENLNKKVDFEKMYHQLLKKFNKREKLTVIMKERHKRLNDQLRYKIKKLEDKIKAMECEGNEPAV
ncbi:uncharacterized protein LOC106643875 [Copidosoma floridanum]|uniref:uncharacterized protein LOC106643875 n=1 Tax=Copidosoma floridanum TaxID=29053 RepID=UPI0006C95565|nr:uncharacterized protein LOC106643875 [Copidosoma floridanum]